MKFYEIESRNRFLEVVDAITRSENKPKSKVTFLAEVDLTEIETLRAQAAARGETRPS